MDGGQVRPGDPTALDLTGGHPQILISAPTPHLPPRARGEPLAALERVPLGLVSPRGATSRGQRGLQVECPTLICPLSCGAPRVSEAQVGDPVGKRRQPRRGRD